MLTHEQRHEMITMHAWEKWTRNGLNMDEETRAETTETVQMAATLSWEENFSDTEWLTATLDRLVPRFI